MSTNSLFLSLLSNSANNSRSNSHSSKHGLSPTISYMPKSTSNYLHASNTTPKLTKFTADSTNSA